MGDCRGFFFNTTVAPNRVTHENLRFESCDLSDGDFARCNLVSPVFENCRFESIDFKSIRFEGCRFESAFSLVGFLGAWATSHLTNCHAAVLESCDLSLSTFKKMQVDADCVLSNTSLPQAGRDA